MLCIFFFRKPAKSKQAWPKCHIINYLLEPYWRLLALGRFLYKPRCARFLLPRPRANWRTFARNFSNIEFFLKILPLKDDELVMSEM